MTQPPDPAAGEQAPAASEPPEWWDDPALPWRHRPSRLDLFCLSALGVVAVYALVMLPLRPVMLGLAPHVLGSLGYRTGLIMTGALASTGDPWWPGVLALGALLTIKFHWVYWLAGRLWGREILDVFAKNKSARTRAVYDKAWAVTHRFDVLMLVATFLPIPLPSGVVLAAVGAAGTSLRRFLVVCGLSSLATSAGYLYLGYRLGEPAVAVMDAYGRCLWYVSLAFIAGMIALALWRSRRRPAQG